jgi:hypothetical protein
MRLMLPGPSPLTCAGLCVSGLLTAWATSGVPWGDTPAPVAWVVGAGLLLLVWALRRPPLIVGMLYATILVSSLPWSLALGSSWAAVTWLPVLVAALELSRASRAFILAMTGFLLVRDAVPMVILATMMGPGVSGSPLYFYGFVGVVAAPIWFRLAVEPQASIHGRILKSAALILSALAVWAVTVSGSRAAIVGLAVVVVAALLGPRLAKLRQRGSWVPTLSALAVAAILVLIIDVGLGAAFGTGLSTAVPAVTERAAVTAVEVEGANTSLGGIRVPLWWQAAVALGARPLGHGAGSYAHVNYAYQDAPLLWSGSPHSVWALAAVETGVPGLVALLALVIGGLWVAARRGSPAMPALLGATAVMSLDIFSSMPLQSLIWWAAIGAAWGPSGSLKGWVGRATSIALAVVLVLGVYMGWRLAAPCGKDCDPIAWYGGHPRLVGAPSQVIGDEPDDPRWEAWRQRYPLAFWLAYGEAMARTERDAAALIDLLRAYPFQSAQTYVDVSDAFAGQPIAQDIAACGLVRFFDGRAIHRDWRAQGTELADQRAALEARTGSTSGEEEACVRAGIPSVAVGRQ